MTSTNLVAYFSATGTTANLAKTLAQAIDADLYEIKPEVAYTKADLDWTNNNSRTTKEMNDKSFRPPIDSQVENMAQYDTIFVGFPIWWYTAPTIINTFLEQYDLAGKTVVPFATSGSSDMGNANGDLAPSCPGATLKEGKRFAADAGAEELQAWAESAK